LDWYGDHQPQVLGTIYQTVNTGAIDETNLSMKLKNCEAFLSIKSPWPGNDQIYQYFEAIPSLLPL